MKRRLTTLAAIVACGLTANANAQLIISEYVEGSSYNKAIELYNTSANAIDLSNYQLKYYFNGNTTSGKTIQLSGTIAGEQTYVIVHGSADTALTGLAQLVNSGSWFNGDDAIVLEQSGNVIDSIGQIGVDPGTYWGTTDLKTADMSLRRKSTAVADTNPNDAYDPLLEWNGAANDDFSNIGQHSTGGTTNPGVIGNCGEPATLIHDIQGSGTATTMANTQVIVEAIVVGDFQDSDQLNGFFIQEETDQFDNNAATSEGLFVYEGAFEEPVATGDVVRVAGTVQEFGGKTQLSSITELKKCGTAIAQATSISLPVTSATALEAYEGMLVSFNQELIVTENYNLARYGELVLSSTERLFQPTQLFRPGTDANNLAAQNALNKIVMDDGRTGQNPAQVVYPTGGLSATNTVRSGDKVTALVGVVDEAFSAYRVQPIAAPSFTHVNQRTAAPVLSGTGNLRIASFNVLNYFNGDGQGGGFPTARGADTLSEFNRQRAKIINAILAMNADIIGIMEMENDGFGPDSAIQDLINGLNANAAAGTTYAFVNPGLNQIGTDAIAVGLIYRTETVEESGNAVTTSDYPFDQKNRQPLVQSFRHKATNEEMTISVNHFKSKGSCPTDGSLDEDQGDWQGCWNARRTAASTKMAEWLATNPTGVNDSDIIIMGDLNGYAMEDPVYQLEQLGYVNIARQLHGAKAYSFVFTGLSGSLDHAMLSGTLADKVVDVTDWHINADEPRALDYNEEFQTPEQVQNFYASDVYRASDHDPIIIELNGGDAPQNQAPTASFSFDCNDLACSFNGSNSSDSDGTITSYAWNFADNSNSVGVNATHTFAAAGTYSVALTVTDNGGATHTSTQQVTVTAATGNTEIFTNISGARRSWTDYQISIPEGTTQLTITLTGGAGDADLYLKFGDFPSRSDYNCRSQANNNEEVCTITNPQAGFWYASLYGFKSFSGVTMTVHTE